MMALIPIALFGWIPVVLLIFWVWPPRRAVIFATIFGWLFLPYAAYDLPGLPSYSKLMSTSLGILLGTLLFRIDYLRALRPRWSDLPMATWCLCPIASSLSNGLGLYDGISTSFATCVSWGLPYLIGRVYITRLEHLREVAIGVVAGGLAYVPLCLWEMRMSPHLHLNVYGIDPAGWGEIVFGGYRPKVFMSCALELGFWMTAASCTGIWLWASGALKHLRGIAFGRLLIPLVVAAVSAKIVGSWFSLLLGASLWVVLKSTRSRLPALILLLVPVTYIAFRGSGLWSGEQLIALVESAINERRSQSLGTRILNENQLVEKALQRPLFGWGGWSRARVYDEGGTDISITDGMWVIALGNFGLVGLISFYTALLLPMAMLIRRFEARAWLLPTVAPACVLATVANLYAIDCIANAMINPIYIFALGGLLGVLGNPDQRGRSPRGPLDEAELSEILENYENSNDYYKTRSGALHPVGHDPREEAAIRLGMLGRALMGRGMTREAEEAWLSAMQHWAGLAADYPDVPEYRKCWLDGLNDSAWSLIVLPGLKARDVSRAIQLAEQAVGLEPGGATYWNTLGIAYFRAGDWKAATHALERSMELSAGGTSFDYYFLAMACWRQGDGEQARRWCSRANAWMEEHNPDHGDLLRIRAEATSLLDPRTLSV
jgi:tetratricopeptide (TPR) repeat protein